MEKNTIPPDSLRASSFIVKDEKKKEKAFVELVNTTYVDGSGAFPDVAGVPLNDQFLPDLPLLHEAVGNV